METYILRPTEGFAKEHKDAEKDLVARLDGIEGINVLPPSGYITGTIVTFEGKIDELYEKLGYTSEEIHIEPENTAFAKYF